jgi:hypothetical protein
MAKERTAYAPFSLTSEAGVGQTPVEGYIDVRQEIYPTVSTGTINENGKWTGVKSSDRQFIGISKAENIPDGGEVLFPDTNNFPRIDMTGFRNMYIAIKTTRGGNYNITAVMGPDTIRFGGLEPVNAAAALKGNVDPRSDLLNNVLGDTAETLTSAVWNIYILSNGRYQDHQNVQFKITNNTGNPADIEFAFMRLV